MNLEKINSLIKTKNLFEIKKAVKILTLKDPLLMKNYADLYEWLIKVYHVDDFLLATKWINKESIEEKILIVVSLNELFIGNSERLEIPINFYLFFSLKTLKISAKNIVFHDSIDYPESLSKVHLYYYEGFLEGLYGCKGIKSLVLSVFNEARIEKIVQNFPNLEELELINPNLEEVSLSILNLVKLRRLSIGNPIVDAIPEKYNKVKNICFILSQLKNIENLKIFNIDLSLCKGFLHNYRNLEELEMVGCNLKKLPKEILSLKNLKKIDFSYNNVVNIPKWINNLSKEIEFECE